MATIREPRYGKAAGPAHGPLPRRLALAVLALAGLVVLLGKFPVGAHLQEKAGSHPASVGPPPPVCGLRDDGKVRLPPDWTTFRPPPAGQSYVDPVFGCQVTRVTDSHGEEARANGRHFSLMHHYSTWSPLNATDSMLLIVSLDGAWRVQGLDGKPVVPADRMPAMNNGHPVWDASDGSIFYYARGETLYRGQVEGHAVKSTALHAFKEYVGIVSPDAADLSQDGGHLALVGQRPDHRMDIFVWSLTAQTKTSVYTTTCEIQGSITTTTQPGCLHKLQLTPDNRLSIEFAQDGSGAEQGLRLWDGHALVPWQDTTNHYDTGYDLNHNLVFIAVGNPSTLPGLKNPCPSGWGLDVRQENDLASAVCLLDHEPSHHVSYRGDAPQPWAVLSFFDSRPNGPEFPAGDPRFQPPSPQNWQLYEDEIVLARVDGGAIYRLAHARSRSAENYWAQPHAAISRDGRYVVFSSNMAWPSGCPQDMLVPNECTDVYLIKVR